MLAGARCASTNTQRQAWMALTPKFPRLKAVRARQDTARQGTARLGCGRSSMGVFDADYKLPAPVDCLPLDHLRNNIQGKMLISTQETCLHSYVLCHCQRSFGDRPLMSAFFIPHGHVCSFIEIEKQGHVYFFSLLKKTRVRCLWRTAL